MRLTVAIAVVIIALLPTLAARADTPTATRTLAASPTLSPSGTPTPAVPNAPSNLHALGGVLTWQDNSTNETGFRVVARLFGSATGTADVEHSYDLPPDSSSFVLPTDARPDCDRSNATWSVYAAIGSILSAPAVTGVSVDCAPTPVTTATPAGAMTVRGTIPIPPGATVQIQAFDEQAHEVVYCAATVSVAESGTAVGSAFSVVVPSACEKFTRTGLPLRISVNSVIADNFFPFTANTTLDLGMLTFGRSVLSAPNAGSGRVGEAASFGTVVLALIAAGAVLVLAGSAARIARREASASRDDG